MENTAKKFDNSVKAYQKLVDTKLDNGDLEGALSVLLHIKDKSKSANIFRDIAEIYEELEVFDQSIKYWFKFLSSVNKRFRADAYRGLGTCYFYLGNIPISSYYFNENVMLSGKSVELNEEMFNCFANLLDKDNNGFRFVYPPESVDCSSIMEEAKNKLMSGCLEEAISLYSQVEKGNPDYVEARCQTSVAYFMKGDIDFAIAISKDVVKNHNPNSIFALCNLSSMYAYKGDFESSAYYYNLISDEHANDINEYYKIATAALEKNDYERAKVFLRKILIEKPYDKNINFILAITEYNSGNKDSALNILSKLLRIYEKDSIVEYYWHYINSRDGETVKKPLEFFYRLPKEEESRRVDVMGEMIKKPDRKFVSKKLKENPDLIDWCLNKNDLKFQHTACFFLAVLGDKTSENKFLDILLTPTIYDDVKEYIIKMLVLDGFEKTIGVVVSNFYKEIVFKDIELGYDEKSMLFFNAYASCFAFISLFTDYNTEKIKDSVYELYSIFFDDKKFNSYEHETIASVLLLYCNYNDFTTAKNTAEHFGADEKEVVELLEYIKEKTNNESN